MKKKYSLFISLFALFLMLTLLFGRMAWKYDLNFNHETLDICNEAYNDCNLFMNGKIDSDYLKDRAYYLGQCVNDIYASNIDKRNDYLYLLNDIGEDLSLLYVQPDEVCVEYVMPDFQNIIIQYNVFKIIFIVCSICTIITLTLSSVEVILYIKKKKNQCL